MRHTKAVAAAQGVEYLLTYADNFAIGYFLRQGFSRNISMQRERWRGLIKEYNGGTPMECYIHPNADYVQVCTYIYTFKYI
ncbi:hypothetical protein B484DRAFT_355464 [Ochromonadaceae sp. CCMP2298]|nr:hypothetical protein B484DRAFT_355464 [Ochromonadaceae sp. CCMP2298]